MNKGITKRGDKWLAQYWNKELKTTIHIGQFDTAEIAAQKRQEYIKKVSDGVIDDSLPKTKGLPKGVKTDGKKFYSSLQFLHGIKKEKRVNAHIGTFDTVEEAVEGRRKFIEGLL